jgi:hypothetical protein
MTMLAMGKHWRLRCGLLLTLVVLGLASACSRPVGLQGSVDSHEPDPQSVPFRQGSDTSAMSNSGPHAGAQRAGTKDEDENDPAAARGVPFKASSRILSAGTLLTVRLESSLSSAKLDMGRTFVAVVDEPVVIGGSAVVSREATVRGRVESAQVSDVRRNAGYVRLTLESIRIEGKDVPLQTSSLFVRGTADDGSGVHPGVGTTDASPMGQSHPAQSHPGQSTIIRLKKGRRLTFRLTEALDLGNGGGDDPVSSKPPLSSKTQPTTE